MTGTLIVAKGKSLDVRTIDFERIADAMRNRLGNCAVVAKLLQARDEFGMDMICADELSPEEFSDFYRLLGDIRAELCSVPPLMEFIERVAELAKADERFFS